MTTAGRLARLEALHRLAPCPCETVLIDRIVTVSAAVEDGEGAAEHPEFCPRCGKPRLLVFVAIDMDRI